MNSTRLLRIPALSAVSAASLFSLGAVLLAAASLGGCASDCKEVDGKTVCEAESLVQYRGDTVSLPDQPYVAGQRLRVKVQGGNVRLGSAAQASVTVAATAPAGTITSFCVPIVAMKAEEKDAASAQMKNNVSCTAEVSNGEVVLNVFRTGDRDSSLTAQLSIGVPADFTGPVTLETENGDVSLAGVRGAIDAVVTGIGTIGVYPASPITASDPGRLYTKHGDIQFKIPAGSNLAVTAQASDTGEVFNNTGITPVEGSTSQAMTLVVGTGGQTWALQSDFGDVEVSNQ
jgi:hypothetical protein